MVSLISGVFLGALIINNWNPFTAFSSVISDFALYEIGKDSQVQVLAIVFIIGGFIALVTASGGSSAFAKRLSKTINSKKKLETAMWLSGLFVWFSDAANSLLIGPVYQPIADRLRVSREKCAYILDSTTSPVCTLVPFIAWGVYIMSLIQNELDALSFTAEGSWNIFMRSIPFQFYSWLTLIMVGFLALTQMDFGPMKKARTRIQGGLLLNKGAVPMRNTRETYRLPRHIKPMASTMIFPLITLLGTLFLVLFLNGFPVKKISEDTIRLSIALGFASGSLVCILLSLRYRIMTFKKSQEIILSGMSDMLSINLILVFAWSLGSICKTMGTADYIIALTRDFLNPSFLPVMLFILGCLLSFSTGSSWGPFAILMPIAIPMSIQMGSPIYLSVAAVISGGLFGDHCSPLSDTTILASMGSACDHLDHFKTQFPYALLVAIISALLFFIAGFISNVIVIFPGIVIMGVLIRIFHKKAARNP